MANRVGLGNDKYWPELGILQRDRRTSIPYLMAFNELQHQLCGYLRHSQTKDDGGSRTSLRGFARKRRRRVSNHAGDNAIALRRKSRVTRLESANLSSAAFIPQWLGQRPCETH